MASGEQADASEDLDPVSAAVLEDALAATDGEPTCSVCPSSADFYLYEADRVSTFACWEHVSPYAAAVNGSPTDAGRPVAIPLPAFRDR